eukprot:TRINITY_DN16795_c0_g1_i2.p2 TRINITY_DN16795_c0_g1~~TRINITY_DN16795_c0_g1_i2.p2  ORF type:complete len:565 (+),score=73.01 TRINITY_DN16795_c0_g1_i2:1946-3640(+)
MAVDTSCTPLGTLVDLSLVLHPTQIDFGNKDNQYFGCLVGGIIIVACASIVSAAAVRLLRLLDRDGDGLISKEEVQGSFLRFVPVVKKADNYDIAAVARHPNTILLAALFIYQGLAFCSMRILFSGHEPLWRRIIGGVFAAVTFAYPFWVRARIRDGVTPRIRPEDGPGAPPRADARVRRWDVPLRPPVLVQYALLSELGDWVSRRREKHWVNSWQAEMRPFTAEHAPGGAFVELMAMWALGLVNAPPTPSVAWCGHVRVGAAVVHFVQLGYTVFACPYRCARDTVVTVVRHCSLTAGLLILAIGFYGGSHDGSANEEAVSACLSVAAIAVLLRVVVNLAAEAALLTKGWRAHSQRLEWGVEEGEEAAGELRLLPHGERSPRVARSGSPSLSCRSLTVPPSPTGGVRRLERRPRPLLPAEQLPQSQQPASSAAISITVRACTSGRQAINRGQSAMGPVRRGYRGAGLHSTLYTRPPSDLSSPSHPRGSLHRSPTGRASTHRRAGSFSDPAVEGSRRSCPRTASHIDAVLAPQPAASASPTSPTSPVSPASASLLWRVRLSDAGV